LIIEEVYREEVGWAVRQAGIVTGRAAGRKLHRDWVSGGSDSYGVVVTAAFEVEDSAVGQGEV